MKVGGSKLEHKFALVWRALGGPKLEREVPVCADRKWRFDFVHAPTRTAFELQGGIFSRGAHARGTGLERDYEKLNRAQQLGWTVFQLSAGMVTRQHLEPILAYVRQMSEE